jgi:hypothetical protein
VEPAWSNLAIAHALLKHVPYLSNGIRIIANVFALTRGRVQLRNTGIQGHVSVKLCLLFVQQTLSGMMQQENATADLNTVSVTKYGTQICVCA